MRTKLAILGAAWLLLSSTVLPAYAAVADELNESAAASTEAGDFAAIRDERDDFAAPEAAPLYLPAAVSQPSPVSDVTDEAHDR